jgi:hypothetical protein
MKDVSIENRIAIDKIENVIFNGGGTRCFSFYGSVQELNRIGCFKKLKRFAGTSAGSLFAAMMACDFTAEEINNTKDTLCFDISKQCCVSNIYNIFNSYGINSLDMFEEQVRSILSLKVDPEITLKDLFNVTNKDLVIVTCCLNRKRAVYLHHAQFPNVKLCEAIIASMAVPFFFKPKEYDFLGTNDLYSDGGIVDNYALWVFNDIDKLYNGDLDLVSREKILSNTIGLKLFSEGEHNTEQICEGREHISNLYSYASNIVNTVITHNERVPITQSWIDQTIEIRTGNACFLDLNMSNEIIETLIDNGRIGVKNFFVNKKI